MGSIPAPVAALLASVAVLLTGNGLQNTLLPIRAQIEGFSTFSIGVLGSLYFAGFAAGCLLGPWLIERIGHIRTFAAMAAIATARIRRADPPTGRTRRASRRRGSRGSRH